MMTTLRDLCGRSERRNEITLVQPAHHEADRQRDARMTRASTRPRRTRAAPSRSRAGSRAKKRRDLDDASPSACATRVRAVSEPHFRLSTTTSSLHNITNCV
ncbi:MAG: hypothetical protein ACXWA9_15530 [Acidimicrobiia bacterium]